jgi:TolB-like protein/Flp pilus assembly protein TadD/predicted Ser/Thr protein kinase
MIGKTISHYRILQKLGEGGMGVVYKAEDATLQRTVALKFLPDEMTRDPEAKERFLREARAAAALNHPSICTVHEIEKDEGLTFIAMELVEGESLRSKIESGVLDLEHAVDVTIQVADGLREAHRKHIVHRDIKPANIMVTAGGRAKLMDFGLASLGGTSQLTKAGTTLGTVSYMSPEQARGQPVDHRTDIWSLGVVLYEAVTGRRPFRGSRDQAVIHSIINEPPEPMSAVLPSVPPPLQSAVSRMLSKTPETRYQTAEELLVDLEAIRQGSSWAATRQLSAGLGPSVKKALAALPPDAPSIAVLPFTDMSPEKNQEYFVDGLSEELLAALSRLRGLRVAARTSAFAFKGKHEDIREIGRKLNVTTLLEGSVRKAGEQVRITAQLISVADGFHLWSDTYDHRLEDIFAIQEDIARSVAQALRVTLLGGREDALRARGSNAEAFSLMLRAKHLSQTYTKENLERAVTCLQEALELDPDYAAAWTDLAYVCVTQALWLYIPFDEGYRRAREAVTRALAIDPDLASAHRMLCHIRTRYDWDFGAAKTSADRALALEPGNGATVGTAGNLAMLLGRLDEAVTLGRRALELDPLNPRIHNSVALSLYNAGRLTEARAAYERALELNPQYPNPHIGLGNVCLAEERWEEALAEYEEHSPDPVLRLLCRALAYPALGRQEEADAALRELIEEHPEDGAFQIAEIYSIRGEIDEAFAWLERAWEARDLGLVDMKVDMRFKALHGDPRWGAFLERMGLGG